MPRARARLAEFAPWLTQCAQQMGQAAFAAQHGFTKVYRCRSVAFHKPELEKGGKIVLPASALDLLCAWRALWPVHWVSAAV